jgi:hypothetical protein
MYLSTPRKNKKRKYNTFIFIISSIFFNQNKYYQSLTVNFCTNLTYYFRKYEKFNPTYGILSCPFAM